MTAYDPTPANALLSAIATHNLWRHVTELAVTGHTVVPNAIPQEETAVLRSRADALLNGPAAVDDPCGRRVWNLLRHDRRFTRVLTSPAVDTLLTFLVGETALLSSLHISAIDPGAPPQETHHDVPLVPPPLPTRPLLANTIWCLDDWHRGRGATEVIPGSHLAASWPPSEPPELTTIECAAGSAIVINGNLWHRSSAYTTNTATPRIAVLALYCRRNVATQESYEDIATSLADDDQQLARRLGVDRPYPFGTNGPDQRFATAQANTRSPFI